MVQALKGLYEPVQMDGYAQLMKEKHEVHVTYQHNIIYKTKCFTYFKWKCYNACELA